MKHLLFILLMLFTLNSCKEEVEKPENLIPRTEMKAILKDLYLYKQVKNYKLSEKLPEISQINLAILQSHGYTLEEFKTSYGYYVINDAAYDELLKEILEELKDELPQQKDSILKVDKIKSFDLEK